MKIVEVFSSFGGKEHLQIHQPNVLIEIERTIIEAEGFEDLVESTKSSNFALDRSPSDPRPQRRVAVHIGNGEAIELSIARHLSLYLADHIDVGIEIVAAHAGARTFPEFSPRNRGVPAVPLVLIGVAP